MKRVALVEVNWLPTFEKTCPHFGTAQILHDCDVPPGAIGGLPNSGARRGLRLVRAVRKIETEDLGAARHQRVEHAVGIACRADGRDDFCPPHSNHQF